MSLLVDAVMKEALDLLPELSALPRVASLKLGNPGL